MTFLDWSAFIPGVHDLIDGNEKYGIMSANEKVERAKQPLESCISSKRQRK